MAKKPLQPQSKTPLNPKLLEEAEKKYPRIDKTLAARRLMLKYCPRCSRKLHKAFDNNDDVYYYCTCSMDLLVDLRS